MLQVLSQAALVEGATALAFVFVYGYELCKCSKVLFMSTSVLEHFLWLVSLGAFGLRNLFCYLGSASLIPVLLVF